MPNIDEKRDGIFAVPPLIVIDFYIKGIEAE